LLTGIVTWAFRSVDPATGTLPFGVTEGFLPVNDDTRLGEGFVKYIVRSKSALPTGTRIDQQASIVFDFNDAILTPVFTNTIDAGAPSSHVAPLPATTTATSFNVSWSGMDDGSGPTGSGIAMFDIYVSDNNGAYTRWQDDTTLSAAQFTGQTGHTYRFYSVATDNVGHIEQKSPIAEATTTIGGTAQATTTAVTSSHAAGSTYGELVTFTAIVSAASGTPTGTVQFQIDSVDVGMPVALSGGAASFSISTLTAGQHTISAIYSSTSQTDFLNSQGSVMQLVNRALLTITADNKTTVSGDPLPPLTASYQGLVSGDTPASLDTPPTLSTTATATSPAGDYPILVSGASDANYTINFVNGNLHVTPPVPTVGADLLVTSTGPSTVVAGKGFVTYRFTVKNIGTLDATNVKVNLASVLPPGVTVKSISAPRGTSFSGTSGNGTWNISKLKRRSSVTLCVTLSVGAATSPGANIQSTATAVFANQGLINTANDSTTQTTRVTTHADVSIARHTAPKSVQAGANITYTITVTNNGPTAASNVSLVDLLPVGTTFVQQVQTSGPGFVLSNTPTQVGNTIASLAPHASATFAIVAQVNGELRSKEKLTSKATVSSSSSDLSPWNNCSTVYSTVSESAASLNASPTDPSKHDLVVTGSSKRDTILVEPSGNKVSVKLNGKSLGSFHPTGNIVVYGRAGDDHITISPHLSQPAIVFGASGDDKLIAGAGNSVLSGGDGRDHLIAGTGRNILIGGKHSNTLDGTKGENLLIGASTSHDTHQVALELLLAEWSRSDAGYSTRIDHLRGTLPGVLNDVYKLTPDSAVDNGSVDSLMGGLGEDWFFAHTTGGNADHISALQPGELVDAI
jgi:uncharacterized repeat protein (TIGR01451 family)